VVYLLVLLNGNYMRQAALGHLPALNVVSVSEKKEQVDSYGAQ
jgi:hypothetical protein